MVSGDRHHHQREIPTTGKPLELCLILLLEADDFQLQEKMCPLTFTLFLFYKYYQRLTVTSWAI